MRSLRNNKKGFELSYYPFMFFFLSIFLITVASTTLWTKQALAESQVTVSDENAQNIAKMKFITGSCFTKYDSFIQRYYGGEISIEKFTQANLDGCYKVPYNSDDECFKFTLLDAKKKEIAQSIQTKNYQLKCLSPKAELRPVQLWDKDKLVGRGYMKIEGKSYGFT